MPTSILAIADNARLIIESIVIDDAGLLQGVRFRGLLGAEPLIDREAAYSAMRTSRTFVVEPGDLLSEGWHAGPRAELEQLLVVSIRYVDAWGPVPSGALSRQCRAMIADDRALLLQALLRTPFGAQWTATSFVSIHWQGSVTEYPADNADVWIAEEWYRVVYER